MHDAIGSHTQALEPDCHRKPDGNLHCDFRQGCRLPENVAEPFLQRCWRRRRHSRCGRGRLGNFGSGHGFDNDRRRLSGLYRGRGSRLCSLSNTWRTGVRCLQHRNAMLKSPHPIAGIQRHHQSDDGDDRYCQDQKPNYDDFRHRSSPRMDESRQCYFAEKESDSGRTALW
ncbi:MAG: hypothetical protein WCD30_11315, partial [Pseudolabrys sp.]